MAEYPASFEYSQEHEWIGVEGATGTIGITDHAQSELGDVVFIELPAVGANFHKGEPFGSIESVKAVSELYAPVSGEVLEVHDELVDRPELINDDPHGEGWMIRMRVEQLAELDGLMSAERYQRFIEDAD